MKAAFQKFAAAQKPSTESGGFSLLELVATLAVLSTLTAIATVGFNGKGGIIGQIKSANIDEAKALLNTAAADCLQKSRLNNEDKDIVDDTIISDQRIKPIGFAIDKANNADKCSYFQLVPTNENDDVRYPIGFSVSDGVLSKFATPTSSDQGSISSCERWAGVNCKQDESIKKLIEWKQNITAEKTKCEDNYSKWLTEDNTTPYKSERWNPNAETGCPTRPAKDGNESYRTDPTCTPNGCNRDVYGLDGEFVGFTKEDYDRALENKYGKLCTEWVAEQEQQQITNDTTKLLPITKTPECGSQEFWFFEGEDQGTKEKFMETACTAWINEKATQSPPYTNNPIDLAVTTPVCGTREMWFVDGVDYLNRASFDARQLEKKSEKCEADREKARASGFMGKWGPKEGPGVCAEESYICDRKIVSEYEFYKTCGAAPQKCKTNLRATDQECTDYELSDYWYKKCGPRPKDLPPINCKYVGRGKPSDLTGWDKTPQCGAWARCMNLF